MSTKSEKFPPSASGFLINTIPIRPENERWTFISSNEVPCRRRPMLCDRSASIPAKQLIRTHGANSTAAVVIDFAIMAFASACTDRHGCHQSNNNDSNIEAHFYMR